MTAIIRNQNIQSKNYPFLNTNTHIRRISRDFTGNTYKLLLEKSDNLVKLIQFIFLYSEALLQYQSKIHSDYRPNRSEVFSAKEIPQVSLILADNDH